MSLKLAAEQDYVIVCGLQGEEMRTMPRTGVTLLGEFSFGDNHYKNIHVGMAHHLTLL